LNACEDTTIVTLYRKINAAQPSPTRVLEAGIGESDVDDEVFDADFGARRVGDEYVASAGLVVTIFFGVGRLCRYTCVFADLRAL
jgi:hypothetical protein